MPVLVKERTITVSKSSILIDFIINSNKSIVLMKDNVSIYALTVKERSLNRIDIYHGQVISSSLAPQPQGNSLLLALLLNNYTINVYRIEFNGSIALDYSSRLNPLLYMPRDIALTDAGYLAVGGAFYSDKYGLQSIIILYYKDKIIWNKTWISPGGKSVSKVVANDNHICAMTPPSNLRCFDYNGNLLINKNLGNKIVFIKDLGNNLLVNYIYNNRSYINLINYKDSLYSIEITPYITTDANLDSISRVIVLSGPLKIDNKFYPGFIYFNYTNFKNIYKIKIDKKCSRPPIVLNTLRDKLIYLSYICNNTLFIDELKIVYQTGNQTIRTTPIETPGYMNKLVILHYTLLSLSIILLIFSFIIYKKKTKSNTQLK